MGDRELPSANRTVARRLLAQRQAAHAAALVNVKSTLPSTAPPTFDFLSQRSKRNQQFMERAAAIERDNLILLEKMRRVMAERQMVQLTAEPFAKDSLNRGRRQQQMMEIMTANEALLRRIQCRRPVYEVAAFEREHAAKESRLGRIGRFPYVSDSVPDATPPPIPNNKIRYYGHAGRHLQPGSTTRRPISMGAPGAAGTLPKIGALAGGSGSMTARKSATASSSSPSRYASTARAASSSSSLSPTRPSPPSGSGGAVSARKNKIHGARALVYTGQSIVIDGVTVQLSVYERAAGAAGSGAAAAGLEFVAMDPPVNSSTGTPVIYSFKALADAFALSPSQQQQQKGEKEESKDSSAAAAEPSASASSSNIRSVPLELFNDPARTRELIMQHLLARLTWRPAAAGAKNGTRQLCMRGVEEEKTAASGAGSKKGPTLYARVHLDVRHLPADQVAAADPVGVLYALQDSTRQYVQIAHCTLDRRADGGSHAGSLVLPYHARVDGPLRLGVFEVDGASGAVMPSSCLGETKFHVQALLGAKELVVKLQKSGVRAAGKAAKSSGSGEEPSVRITHEKLAEKPAEEDAEQEDDEYAQDDGFEAEEGDAKPPAEEAKEEQKGRASSVKSSPKQSPSKKKSASASQALVASAVAAADAAIAAAVADDDDEYADDTVEEAKVDDATAKKPSAGSTVAAGEDDDEDVGKKAPKLFQRGREISGLEFLVRGVDSMSLASDAPERTAAGSTPAEPNALLFQLYYRPTSAVFNHAVSKAELPSLLAALESPSPSGALAAQAQALLSLFSATVIKDAQSPPSVQFNGKPLVAWKDLKVFKASSKATPSSSVTASPKTSPRATKKTASLERLTSSSKKSTSSKDTPAPAAAGAKKKESSKKAGTDDEAKVGSASASVAPSAAASAAPSVAPSVAASPSASTKDLALGSRKGSQTELSRKGSMKKGGTTAAPAAAPAADATLSPQASKKKLASKASSAAAAPGSQPGSPKANQTKTLTATAADDDNDFKLPVDLDEPSKPSTDEPAAASAAAAKPAEPVETAAAKKGASRPASAQKQSSRPASSKKKPATVAAADGADELEDYGADFDDDLGAGLDDLDDDAADGGKKKDAAAAADDATEKKAAVAEAAKAKAAEAEKVAAAEKKAAEEKAEADRRSAYQKAAADEAAAEAEQKKAEEAEAASAAAAAQAAKDKADADADAKKAAEKEAAESKAKADAAAAEAKKKEEEQAKADATAAEAEAAKKAEADAAEKAKTDAAASAATSIAGAAAALSSGPMTLSMSVRCVGLPAHPKHATLSPMVALYAEDPSTGEYAFHSQTEASAGATPSFATGLSFATDSSAAAGALMFSIYNVVEGAALSEDDMIGQALSTRQDVLNAMQSEGKEITLAIQSGDKFVDGASLILSNITVAAGHPAPVADASAAASSSSAAEEESFDVFVTAKGLRRPGAAAEGSVCPMVALYVQDAESGEYAYCAQTERMEDTSAPLFETAIRVTSSSALLDRGVMFSIYHVAEGAELSADDAIGAGTATLRALCDATEANPLRMQVVREETLLDGAEITAFVKKV